MRTPKDTVAIHDMHLCSKQDLDDINALLIASRALIILNRRKYISSYIQAWIMHALGVGNGMLAIKNAYSNDTKLLSLFYIPLIFYCAFIGFNANDTSRAAKTEMRDCKDKYNSLKNVLQQVTPPDIHNIAKIYRTEVPKDKEEEITIEAIQRALQYIMIKYQR